MKLVIIGGVAGGASAAARARRLDEHAEIVIFERGEYISFANCGLPYHVGQVIQKRENLLVMTPERFKARTRIEVRILQEVTAVQAASHTLSVRNLRTGESYEEHYDKLILAPGASPMRPPIPGADDPDVMVLWTMGDMDRVKERIDAGARRAVIVGAGFLGLELAENFQARGVDTTVVEMLPQVMPPLDPEMTAPLADVLRRHGVHLFLNSGVTRIQRDRLPNGDHAAELTVELKDGSRIAAGVVVLATGVRPNSELARAAGLNVGARGGIVVNEFLQTSDPDIYAVGDAIQVRDAVTHEPAQVPLAGPANRQGRIAADNVFGARRTYSGTFGTSVLKLFQLTSASVGASEKTLRRTATPYEKIYLNPFSHATYFPGARQMHLKLLFAPDGRILGAQIVGEDGVDKRIDVLATALKAGMTVYDLEELELAYAPPYSSAKDPINFAGFVAANVLRGASHVAFPDALPADALLLDVREPAEVETGALPGALGIPLGTLRERLSDLPRDRDIIVYCQVGLRGYLAERILVQNGFSRVRNLSGGYVTWRLFQPQPAPSCVPPAAPAPAPAPTPPPALPAAATGAAQGAAGPGSAVGRATEGMVELDVCGQQCPGPIVALRQALEKLGPGSLVRVHASESSLLRDIPAWCASTGNPLLSIKDDHGRIEAVVGKGQGGGAVASVAAGPKRSTLIMFSDDLDRALAGFIMATGFASLGQEVTMFFSFWGLNILRKDSPPAMRKDLLSRMFGWMMPRGPRKLTLSKMHFAGAGTAMMKYVMTSKQVSSLPELVAQARYMGVKLVACEMAMNVMGIRQEELLDGVETAGVATFAGMAEKSTTTLFI